ncbi:MAG: CAP domain-containing protein [Candidatus Eisenbacteria bacterium]|nr:CAP domain-containing protein [Candidatus Eisenbacteria bacterium]
MIRHHHPRHRTFGIIQPGAARLTAAFVLLGWSVVSVASAQSPTYEDQVMQIVNQERWTNGQLPPLKRNDFLNSSSTTHSTNMAVRNFFAHCDLDTGTRPWDRMTAAGYTGWNSAAENIAAGYSTPAAVMTGWMNSTGHRANLLSVNYREIGIGYYLQSGDQSNVRGDANGDCTADGTPGGPYSRYWTQNFGRKNSVYPVVINREAFQVTNSTVDLYVYGTGWAQEMRFRNEEGAWSAWTTFSANQSWVLSAANGTKTVNAEIRNGATVYAQSDQILLNASADVAVVLSATMATVESGQTWTFTMTTTNTGASNVTNLTISNPLPAGLTFQSASATVSGVGNTITRTVPTLALGASDVVEITLLAGAAGVLVVPVDAQAGEYDPNMANNSASLPLGITASQTGVPGDDLDAGRPALSLRPNQPNPFASATRLSWSQPEGGRVLLTIHDAAGRRVTTLVATPFPAGDHAIFWNGNDDDGHAAAAGLYFSRLEFAGQVRTGKLLLTR